MSGVTPVVQWIKRLAARFVGLLPGIPSSDGAPPDADGRREQDIDPEALLRVDWARKEGKGGYR